MMTINVVQSVNIYGRTFAIREYRSPIKTDNWLIHGPGIGELGPSDGSKFNLIENIGYPKQAKDGFDFPFNIFAIQLPPGWDYWALTSLAQYVKETYKASKLGMTGYSLSGRGCWTILANDTNKYLDFMAPISGYPDTSSYSMCSLRSIPIYAWHGDSDTTMKYQYDKDNIALYNSCSGRPTQIVDGVVQPCAYLKTLPGIAHDAWDIAYDITSGKDSLLQWIIQQFGMISPPIPDPVLSWNIINGSLIGTTQSGKTVSIPGATITS